MANVRELKKEINSMIYDVVEECYSLQLYDDSKREKTDNFIDEAADFQEEIMAQIKKAESKKDFKAIREKVDKTAEEWVKKVNKLQG
tara:strand:- start:51440 stop:51700 length:261 start_codon:yes stop_codon:yes gene_type:complete